MDKKIMNSRNTDRLVIPMGILCVLILLYNIVVHMGPVEQVPMWRTVFLVAIIAQFGLVCALSQRRRVNFDMAVYFMIGYTIWVIVSQLVVDGGNDRVLQGEVCCAAAMCVLLMVGSLLDRKQRDALLKWATVAVMCILLLWMFWSIRVLIFNVDHIELAEYRYIFVEKEKQSTGILRTIQFFDIHRNESAGWYMTAIWLLLVQWFSCKKKYWRIPITVGIVLMYVMVSILHSRSIQVITAAGFAMLAMILLLDRLKNLKLLPKIAVIGLAAILCAAVAYKGTSVCNRLVSQMQMPVAETPAAEEPEQSETAYQIVLLSNKEQTPVRYEAVMLSAPGAMEDQRNFWRDLRTLTMRTEIWGAVGETIESHPELLLFGQPEDEIMNNVREYGNLKREVPHTHNALLQILMLTGAAGAALIAAFVVILVVKMVMFFFSSSPAAQKILTIPLTCILMDGVMEPMLTSRMEFSSLCFMLIAGIFLANNMEQKMKA